VAADVYVVGSMTGSDIAESAKNAGIFLTALSGAAYACGYLVVRARARALGTDPGFVLIDQAYVFAGFRFVLMLLLSLLLTAPLVLLLRWVGSLVNSSAPGTIHIVEAIAALFAGAATICAYVATLGVNGVLLASSSGWLANAALGRNNYGLLMMLATTALGAAMLLWIDAHFAGTKSLDPLGAVLLLIGTLVLILLPLQQGVFYADRNARQLDRIPEGVTDLPLPIWLVDRGALDRAVLYGRAVDGRAELVTIKAEKLDGIGVIGIGSLGKAVGERKP
jgi:hypothetical protein